MPTAATAPPCAHADGRALSQSGRFTLDGPSRLEPSAHEFDAERVDEDGTQAEMARDLSRPATCSIRIPRSASRPRAPPLKRDPTVTPWWRSAPPIPAKFPDAVQRATGRRIRPCRPHHGRASWDSGPSASTACPTTSTAVERFVRERAGRCFTSARRLMSVDRHDSCRTGCASSPTRCRISRPPRSASGSGAGSRHETRAEHGLSHFLEHMAFKGTRRRSARRIAEEIESAGGDLNAATSTEQTAYYARVLAADTGLALDILADILTESVFDPEPRCAREKERGAAGDRRRRRYARRPHLRSPDRRPPIPTSRSAGRSSARPSRASPRFDRPAIAALPRGALHGRPP